MAYETLYREHVPAARRLALALVPPDAAEDVVAEAFTRVISAVRRGAGPQHGFRPYLLTAVRNQATDFYNGRRRLVPVPEPEPAPVPLDGPEAVAERREDTALAVRAFRTLPDRWRWVLWATAVEERGVADLSAESGLSPNGVSQLASRAREGLRQAYLNEHVRGGLPPACRAVAPYMGAAVRGKAGQRHQAQLAAHLRSCERCGQAYAGLGALNSHLGELLVPAAVSSAALAQVLGGARAGVRAGLRAHWPALAASAAAAGLALAVPLSTGHVPFGSHPPGAGAPASPGSLPRAPGSGAPVLADGVPNDVVLPGGDLPGFPLPGGDLPGGGTSGAQPGGTLPGGVLPGAAAPGGTVPGTSSSPGGDVPATSASLSAAVAPLAVGTGTAVPAVPPAGQLLAGTAALLTSPGQAVTQTAGHAAGTVASVLPGQ